MGGRRIGGKEDWGLGFGGKKKKKVSLGATTRGRAAYIPGGLSPLPSMDDRTKTKDRTHPVECSPGLRVKGSDAATASCWDMVAELIWLCGGDGGHCWVVLYYAG